MAELRKPVTGREDSEAPFAISTGVRTADPYVKILLYGEYGCGKTVLAATAADVPRMQDVLFLNAEAGTKSVRESGAVKEHENIDFIRLEDYGTFVNIHKFLMAYCIARDANDEDRLRRMAKQIPGLDPTRRYKTVIVDSLFEIEQMNLSRITGVDQLDLSEDAPDYEWKDYGRNRNMLHRIIRAFRDLPMHVILTCPSDYEQDEQKKFLYRPKLTGKLSKELQGFMDIVGFLVVKKGAVSEEEGVRRRLWLQPVDRFDAKSRLTPQDVVFVDQPTMGCLMSKLNRKVEPSVEKTVGSHSKLKQN
jgi:AAA domain